MSYIHAQILIALNNRSEMIVKDQINLTDFPDPGSRYNLAEQLASGVFAHVFSATDTQASDKKVAIKIQQLCDARKSYLEREYKILRDLSSHASLPAFYGVYRKDRDIWFVMELCEAGSIRDLVGRLLLENRRLAEEHIAYILKETVKAVIFLHENRIIHRDIKAKNILLTADGEVKLAGFGFSCSLKNILDKSNTRIGCPCWMAPEIISCARNLESYGNRVDVWALGITAIEMGEGKAPHENMHPSRALFQIVTNPPPSLRRPCNWSANYYDFVNECLVKNPEHRPYMQEVIDHPFLNQIPDNNYHLTLEIKSLLSDVNKFDEAEPSSEVSIMGKYLKQGAEGVIEPMIVEDLASLDKISENRVMAELEARMEKGEFQTFVGDVLVVLNPAEKLENFGSQFHSKYSFKSRSDNEPHIYAVADSAYQNALHHGISQKIVLSGESGSGKTRNYLHLTEHLLYLGQNQNINLDRLKNAVKLIHSFTHASTPINDYSTRCVFTTELKYGRSGKVSGAIFNVQLLEKWRVSAVDMCQGNFHIFYYIYDGLKECNKLKQFDLNTDRAYRYLRLDENADKAGPQSSPEATNCIKFKRILTVFQDFGFTEEEIDRIFCIAAAILNVGEIRLQNSDNEGAIVENDEFVVKVAELLKIDSRKFEWALTNYCLIRRGTAIRKRSTVDEARDARDVLANNLYMRLVDYIIATINRKLSVGLKVFGEKYSVKIFDYCGFECFKENHLPQLFANCLNEELQYHYLQRIFSWEYLDVKEEELDYKPINFYDNKETLDILLNKADGVLLFLDGASKTGRGGTYVLDSIQNLEKNRAKVVGFSEFSIAHYTGRVIYNVKEMPYKNRDFLPPEIIETLQLSSDPLVKLLFTNKLDRNGNLIIISPDDNENSASSRNKNRYQFKSAVERHEYCQIKNMRTSTHIFKAFSLELLKELSVGCGTGGNHFVRCIRTCLDKDAGEFNKELIRQQVRALSIVETAKSRQSGYPHRIPFSEFLRRYQFLAFDFNETVDVTIDNCRLLLIRLQMEGWAIGKSKVFLKYHNEEYLSRMYETQVKKIIKVQSIFRGFLAKCSVIKRIKANEAKCLAQMSTKGRPSLTEAEAAAIIQKAYRESHMRKTFAEFAQDYKTLDEQTCKFIKKFALRWRNNSLIHVLSQYRALRYQDRVNFAQQVHLYNLGAFFDLREINNLVDLDSVDPEAQVCNWLGESKATVLKIPYRMDELPFYDTSHMCNPLTNAGVGTEKSDAWDSPYKWRQLVSPKAAEEMENLKNIEENLIDLPFSRDPDIPMKELPDIPEIDEDKESTSTPDTETPCKAVKNEENTYFRKKFSQDVINKYENTLNSKIAAIKLRKTVTESPKMSTKTVDKEELINSNTQLANKDFDYIQSPKTSKPKPVDPLVELKKISKRSGLTSEDDPPFNFQAMLRKTNFKTDSIDQNTAEGVIKKFSFVKKDLKKIYNENVNGINEKENIVGKTIKEELAPGVYLEGIEVEL